MVAENVWVGTSEGGLNRFDRETRGFVRYLADSADHGSLCGNHVETICEGEDGALWVGTAKGLNRLASESARFERYRHDPSNPESLSHDFVMEVYRDRSSVLWVGTRGGGLNRFDPEDETFRVFRNDPDDPESLSSDNVSFVHEDRSGSFWVGTNGGGLNLFDRKTGKFVRFTPIAGDPKSLGAYFLPSCMEDQAGSLWIGTSANGVSRIDKNAAKFAHFTRNPQDPDSLSSDKVLSIFADCCGDVWVGTTGGLDKFDPKARKFEHYAVDLSDPDSLGHGSVYRIFEDRDEMLWICTWGGGLDRFDRKSGKFAHFAHSPDDSESIGNNVVSSIAEDRSGNLWVGTWGGGLNRFDRATQTFFRYSYDPKDPGGLADPRVLDVHVDHNDVLWVSATGKGVNRFVPETGKFVLYRHDPNDPRSLSHNVVMDIFEDSSGTLWFATTDGLNRFDRVSETFDRFGEKDGLPNSSIQSVVEDDQGNLWLGTNRGLSMFDPREKTFKNYDVADGLQGTSFAPHAACKSPEGLIFFGGNNGFNMFDPEELKENPFVPPVVVTDFQLFNQSVSPGEGSVLERHIGYTDRIVLAHDQANIGFSFAALNFTAPMKNRYTYILEGFDEKWQYTGSDLRLARYTNLPPGGYVFRVKGSNNDGLWNEKGTSVRVYIHPPFWKTPWFMVAAALTACGLLVAGYIKRVEAIESRRRELEVQVKARTVELMRSETRYRELFDAMGSAVAVYDAIEDGDDFVFKEFNWAGEKIEGARREDLIGKRVTEVFPGVRESGLLDVFKKVWKTAESQDLSPILYKDDSRESWRKNYVYKLPSGEVVAVYEDVTERLARQNEILKAKEAAEAANRAKSSFLAVMSHELRTPLNAILGYAQLLAARKDIKPSFRRQIQIVSESGKHLLTLINDILDLSRVEIEKATLNTSKVVFRDFLDNIVGIVRMRAEDKNISFVFRPALGLPQIVVADELRLRQVLLNLLGNAVKFTDCGSVCFDVEAGKSSVEASDAQKATRFAKLVFRVEDTGVGMTEEQLEKIFLPFEQTGDFSRRAQGVGLGLSISKKLAQLMGGEIRVESEPKKGCCFTFEADFPVQSLAEPEENRRSRIITGYRGERKKILIVDDKKENRDVLNDVLSAAGFEVLAAVSAEQAVRMASESLPDIVFMDLVLPVEDGFEATRKICALPGMQDTPVVAISASFLGMSPQAAKEKGFQDFLPKPVDMAKLYGVLERLLAIEWIYEEYDIEKPEGTKVIGLGEIVPPPSQELKQLCSFTKLGMITQLEEAAERLEQSDPQYAAFVARLRQYAEDFEYEKLLDFLDRF